MQSGYDEIGDIIEHAFNGQQAVELIQNAFYNTISLQNNCCIGYTIFKSIQYAAIFFP